MIGQSEDGRVIPSVSRSWFALGFLCSANELEVAMTHALVIIPLALRALRSRILAEDPVFGYEPMVGHVLALSSGSASSLPLATPNLTTINRYFVWDIIDSLLHSTIGFVIHGASPSLPYSRRLFTDAIEQEHAA